MPTQWTPETLKEIDDADDLKIAPLRDDLVTTGTPTWIWSVVVDGGLYVRAYNGRDSLWFKSAIAYRAGKIQAAGRVIDVSFEAADGDIGRKVDDAYSKKYAASPYLPAMIGARARSATVQIFPSA